MTVTRFRSLFPSDPTIERYLRDGRMTAPGEDARTMIERVVAALADADARFPDDTGPAAFAEQLGAALDVRQIVFSTPVMTNAGRPDRPLAACAVPPVDLRGDLARVKTVVDDYHRAGMGTGFTLDGLDDPVAVLRYLNDVAVAGADGGDEDRPVGNMAILSLGHPKAGEFVVCKLGADARGERWKFNISLAVGDDHMRAARTGRGWEHELLTAAAQAATDCADPGLVFADRLEAGNPTPHVAPYASTAPCAEVGLAAGETCQFGYLNLAAFHDPAAPGVPVELDGLREATWLLVRALDDAVEASLPRYPDPASARIMTVKRKIGVGVCGLADLLIAAGLPYDSEDARRLAREVVAFVNYASKTASVDLAERRGGCPAVLSGLSRYADPGFLGRFAGHGVTAVTDAQWEQLAGRVAASGSIRNSSTVALPPTGRSSPAIGASTGIEPLFLLTDPHTPGRLHPGAAKALAATGRIDLIDRVAATGHLDGDVDAPDELRALLATATQISPAGHLAMAAAVQRFVDEAVSKTVNLPAGATAGDVYDVFHQAWDSGCKGITVYRDGSRAVQPKAL